MLRSYFFRSRTSIGLDIQPHEICLLKLRHSRSRFTVEKLKVQPLPEHFHDKAILREGLQKLIQETGTKGQSASIALSAQNIISKKISLTPGLLPKERAAEIADQFETFFPAMAKQLTYDYAVLNRTETAENILLIAARLEHVQAALEIVEEAGLHVQRMEVDVYAMAAAMAFSVGKLEGVNFFLDCHEPGGQLLVIYQNEVIFHQPLLNKSLPDIIYHVQDGLQFCQKHFRHVRLKKIYLTPATSFLEETIQSWGFTISHVNPFSKMTVPSSLTDFLPKMFLACGLALRGCAW